MDLLTETTGGATRTVGPDESRVPGSVGRLLSDCQTKIVALSRTSASSRERRTVDQRAYHNEV